MYASARPTVTALVQKGSAARLSQVIHILNPSSTVPLNACASCSLTQHAGLLSGRQFSSTPHARLQEKYFPPPANTENIKITPPAWHHPIYTEEQMKAIKVAHRQAQNWSDWTAMTLMRIARWGMDTATGYAHPTEEAKRRGSYLSPAKIKSWLSPSPMTERKWLIRFLFLESVAGVPGMVAGSVRHLNSIRRLRRDNGW